MGAEAAHGGCSAPLFAEKQYSSPVVPSGPREVAQRPRGPRPGVGGAPAKPERAWKRGSSCLGSPGSLSLYLVLPAK